MRNDGRILPVNAYSSLLFASLFVKENGKESFVGYSVGVGWYLAR